VKAGGHFDELDGDAQVIAGFSNAAFEQCSNTELLADRANVRPGVAKLKRSGPSRYPQAINVAECVSSSARPSQR